MASNSRTRSDGSQSWQDRRDEIEDAGGAVEKLLPQNLDAETSTLGSLLINPEAVDEVADFLKPEMFYREAHCDIHQSATDLYAQGIPADLITLSDELARRGKLEDIGGISYLSSLANQVPTSANVVHYARIVERTYILRRLIHAAGQIAAVAYNEPDAHMALDQAEQLVMGVRGEQRGRGLMTMPVGLNDALERLDALISHKTELTGVATGLRDLDRITSGLQKSDLIILAARPSVGKTSLSLTMARNAAVDHGTRVLLFSLEMSYQQLMDRLLSMEAGVDLQKIRTGRSISDDDLERIGTASAPLSQAPIYVDDTAGISLLDLRAKARRAVQQYGVDLIIVDYLQLMRGFRPDGKSTENRVQEVSEISRGLKELARELNVPVLALSQLSRAVEGRSDKHPQLSDLRDSGALEQDGDVVMFLYRDDVYNPDTDHPNIADLTIAKHRNGPTGQIQLFFQATETRYRTLEIYGVPPHSSSASEGEQWWQSGKEVE